MSSHPRIERSVHRGEYVGYCNAALRKWRVSGLWEMFRLDSAEIMARDAREAKTKFRARYRRPRSVSGISAYPI